MAFMSLKRTLRRAGSSYRFGEEVLLTLLARKRGPRLSPLSKERGQDVQALASLRKKFRWAIKDKSGFEALLERIRYYNDSLYCLLPKDSIETITRDTLAKLISSATSERLLQYTAAVEPTESRSSINSLLPAQYATIASAAQTSLQIANSDQLSYDNIWIDEQSITYDGEDSCIGTLSKDGAAPARVFVENLRYMPYGPYSEDELTRKASLERIAELALLLKYPRHFGFATMACIGVITNGMEKNSGFGGKTKLIYQIPETADPLGHPVSLYDVLSKKEFRCEEPPDIDVRFKLVSSLANALHEMHCTGWLHRNISSQNIHFLRTKSGNGIESLDLERPYVTGFDAARSFTACSSIFRYRSDLAAAINQHPGYIMLKYWSQQKAKDGNTGDKLFYMPRHDYYSIGLVFLEVGMWRNLQSMLLREIQYFEEENNPPDPDCPLEEKFKALEFEYMFARQGMLDDPDEEDIDEPGRREKLWSAYLSNGPSLVEEEGLVEFVLDEKDLDDGDSGATWSAWDAAYGPHKLRQDALQMCSEKLGSRMGKRYREAVRRCLATDFGVNPKTSKDADWLRAYNWKVVQDLNKCCA